MTDPTEKPATEAASVPKPVVGRLSLYLRELQHLVHSGIATTSSTQLGSVLGFSDTQVRKDLAYVGQFGYPGIGYRCEELIPEIKKVLGTDRAWQVILVGMGNLGRALLRYRGFANQGFSISAIFDVDPEKVGTTVEGFVVSDWSQVTDYIRANQIRLAIIAVPASVAQEVATRLVESGIEGILNFAPTALSLPEPISRVEVDLAIELEQLSFLLVNRPKPNS
jgi:redox-sensing transcriptional repressor